MNMQESIRYYFFGFLLAVLNWLKALGTIFILGSLFTFPVGFVTDRGLNITIEQLVSHSLPVKLLILGLATFGLDSLASPLFEKLQFKSYRDLDESEKKDIWKAFPQE